MKVLLCSGVVVVMTVSVAISAPAGGRIDLECRCRQEVTNHVAKNCSPAPAFSLTVDFGDNTVLGFLLKPRPARITADSIVVVNQFNGEPYSQLVISRASGAYTITRLGRPRNGEASDYMTGTCTKPAP